jgi:hypothetical protein
VSGNTFDLALVSRGVDNSLQNSAKLSWTMPPLRFLSNRWSCAEIVWWPTEIGDEGSHGGMARTWRLGAISVVEHHVGLWTNIFPPRVPRRNCIRCQLLTFSLGIGLQYSTWQIKKCANRRYVRVPPYGRTAIRS